MLDTLQSPVFTKFKFTTDTSLSLPKHNQQIIISALLLHRHLTNLIKNMALVIYSEVYINHK